MISRRQALSSLLASLGLAACGRPVEEDDDERTWAEAFTEDWSTFEPELDLGAVSANLEALFDTMVPAELDDDGLVARPGAVQCGAVTLLTLEWFIPLARAQGLLPPPPEGIDEDTAVLDGAALGLISAELDRMATDQALLTAFRDLSASQREAAVADAFAHAERRPLMEFLRGVAMLAYLGGIDSDLGLVDVGFPRFEDLAGGVACSGYPRTVDGRLVDADTEDLDALDAAGLLVDYTFDEAPGLTDGDDLDGVINGAGDLI